MAKPLDANPDPAKIWVEVRYPFLAARFNKVDARLPRQLMRKWRRDRLSIRIPRKFETVTDLPDQLAPFIAAASCQLSR